jgi:hypothetical protein
VPARELQQTSEQSRHIDGGRQRIFNDTYNQVGAPFNSDAERNLESFGFSGVDRSRPGDMVPSLKSPS